MNLKYYDSDDKNLKKRKYLNKNEKKNFNHLTLSEMKQFQLSIIQNSEIH